MCHVRLSHLFIGGTTSTTYNYCLCALCHILDGFCNLFRIIVKKEFITYIIVDLMLKNNRNTFKEPLVLLSTFNF